MKNNRTFLEKLLDGAEVEWKTLDEISSIYGGLTGKGKADFENGNALYVPYKNIFNNIEVDFNNLDTVNVSDDEKQYAIKYGDVLFTGSSETAEEAGMSSAVTTKTEQKIYLNSFSFGLRFNDDVELLPEFSKFLFRTLSIRKEIVKSASGVTRFNISKARFKKIKIPIPPLSVQTEIVRILDALTALGKVGFEWKCLGETCKKVSSGGTPLSTKDEYYNGDIPWLRTQEVQFNEIWDTEVAITQEGLDNSSAKWIPENCVIVAISGATAGRSAINKIPLTTNQHCCNLQIAPEYANYRYVFHWVCKEYEKLKSLGQGARADLNSGIIKNYPIALPPLREQHRIVSILDKFETLTNSITEGLPLAIEQSQKRYEYYRELLLNFKL